MGLGQLSASEAKSIADEARDEADRIYRWCVVSAYSCSSFDAVTQVKDDLYEHGIRFIPLNDAIDDLEADASYDSYKCAGYVLRKVRDRIITMTPVEPATALADETPISSETGKGSLVSGAAPPPSTEGLGNMLTGSQTAEKEPAPSSPIDTHLPPRQITLPTKISTSKKHLLKIAQAAGAVAAAITAWIHEQESYSHHEDVAGTCLSTGSISEYYIGPQ